MEDGRAAVGCHGAVESLVGHQVPDCSLEETDQTGWQNSPEHCDSLIAILLQVLLSEGGGGGGEWGEAGWSVIT